MFCYFSQTVPHIFLIVTVPKNRKILRNGKGNDDGNCNGYSIFCSTSTVCERWGTVRKVENGLGAKRERNRNDKSIVITFKGIILKPSPNQPLILKIQPGKKLFVN